MEISQSLQGVRNVDFMVGRCRSNLFVEFLAPLRKGLMVKPITNPTQICEAEAIDTLA